MLGVLTAASAAEIEARDLRMAGNAAETRIVLDFSGEPQIHWTLLRGPHRLMIDVSGARLALDPGDAKPRGLVRSVRYGALNKDTARLVLAADGPFALKRFDVAKVEGTETFRLSAELSAATEAAFSEALAAQAQTTSSIRAAPAPSAPAAPRFTVVIDAGHGGFDGGAESANGTVEKEITLAFAKELAAKLEGGDIAVALTRQDDTFLRLDERVAIARRQGADLLVSIHADTIRVPGIHGATVYTVSDKASDPEAEALAIRENLSDDLAGIVTEEKNADVADILVDLIRRETHGLSIHFARNLISEMTGKVALIKNPHRSAGFRVLKAPDVPSVLIELGYLSNDKDEERLRDPEWRATAIGAISRAITDFAGVKTGTARAGG
ncbi:MAG: N-acetylmuramoyl-L-alanine amidase [Mesorhizobium amorphae]|nr:MAG: N-acetylmuramoyl-L-alanine amidase [Mesorhizobium amorphae]